MTTRERIVRGSEAVFDRQGFAATGMDQLTAAIGVSSRTLYKHLGSKTALVVAVLEARRARFARVLVAETVDELFVELDQWVAAEGARGCLFLRARGEYADEPAVVAVIAEYRRDLRAALARMAADSSGRSDELVVDQLLVLVEGAVAAASYRGSAAIDAARTTAARLLAEVDSRPVARSKAIRG